MRRILFLYFALTCFSTQVSAQAKIQGILINADSMFRDSEKGTVELNGNVQVIFKNQHLSSQRAKIWLNAKKVEAEGDVVVTTPTASIHGNKVFMNYETNVGVIYDGYIQSGQVLFEGDIINKEGENEYTAISGKYTACTTCPPGWSFSGSKIKATLGGYARINNTFLRIGSVPILWLPYLVVPLKSTRQTGLLIPEFESSEKGGFAISQPFFWAMSRSSDSTWILKNYEKRGVKTLVNYRYKPSPLSFGELNAATLRDKAYANGDRYKLYRSPEGRDSVPDRWFLKYHHYFDLPNDFIQRSQVNLASDLQYANDFQHESRISDDSAMENRFSLTKNLESTHFSLDTSYYTNLVKSNPLATNEDSVHRLPELRVTSTEKHLFNTPMLYSFDFNYVNFARNNYSYDEVITEYSNGKISDRYLNGNCKHSDAPGCYYSRNGTFETINNPDGTTTSGLIRAGQRLDFSPSLSYPVHLGRFLDIMPKLSYRETQYYFSVGEDPNTTRRHVRAEVSARTTLSSIFNGSGGVTGNRYKHEFQPELIATSIPWIEQPKHSFFGSFEESDIPFFSREALSNEDVKSDYGLQFDYNDRLYDRKLLTLALTNKLIQKRWVDGIPSYRQLATLRIFQSYDAYQADRGNRPWSTVTSIFDLRLDNVESYSIIDYLPYHNVNNTSSNIKLIDSSGNFVQFGLNQQYVVSTDDVAVESIKDYILATSFNTKYVNLLGRIEHDSLYQSKPEGQQKSIKAWAIAALLKPPGDCWSILLVSENTGKDTVYNFAFNFVFDGVKQSNLSSNFLNSYGF